MGRGSIPTSFVLGGCSIFGVGFHHKLVWFVSVGIRAKVHPVWPILFLVSQYFEKKTIRVLYFFLLVLFLFSFLKSVTIVVNFFVTLVSLFKSCSYMCLLLLPSLFVSLFLFSFLKKKSEICYSCLVQICLFPKFHCFLVQYFPYFFSCPCEIPWNSNLFDIAKS